MPPKPRLLITGGTGLVGTAFRKILSSSPISSLQNKYETLYLSSKDADLTSYQVTLALFSKFKPDYVIHLAANVGGLYKNMTQKTELLEKNLSMNFNVLKAAHATNVKKLISTLSTCIFPDKTSYPIDETMLHNGEPHNSNYPYAYAKRMLEIHSRAYNEQYGTKYLTIIPTNIYGENDNYHLEDAHVIPALIHQCYLAKQTSSPFTVRGTGKPLRQFIYSQDLARLIMWVLEEYDQTTPIILAPNKEYTIKRVAETIAASFDYSDHLKFDSSYSDGQYKKTASNKKLLSLCPYVQFTSLETGIKKSVEWFVQNFDTCRK
jgi:GDP-L-fucose synthase